MKKILLIIALTIAMIFAVSTMVAVSAESTTVNVNVETSFGGMENWSGAFQLLMKFKNTETGEYVNDLNGDRNAVYTMEIKGNNGFSKTINVTSSSDIGTNLGVRFTTVLQTKENQFRPEAGVKYTIKISVTKSNGVTYQGTSGEYAFVCPDIIPITPLDKYYGKVDGVEEFTITSWNNGMENWVNSPNKGDEDSVFQLLICTEEKPAAITGASSIGQKWTLIITGDKGYSKTIESKVVTNYSNQISRFETILADKYTQFIPARGENYTIQAVVEGTDGKIYIGTTKESETFYWSDANNTPTIPKEYRYEHNITGIKEHFGAMENWHGAVQLLLGPRGENYPDRNTANGITPYVPYSILNESVEFTLTITGDKGYKKVINVKPSSIATGYCLRFQTVNQLLENQFIPVRGEKYRIDAVVIDENGIEWRGSSGSNYTFDWEKTEDPIIPDEFNYSCKNGHTLGAAATCTTPQICTVCNVEIIPATGHAIDANTGKCVLCGIEHTFSATEVNVAYKKPATIGWVTGNWSALTAGADNFYGYVNVGMPPEQGRNLDASNAWVQVDLGAPFKINNIKFGAAGYGSITYWEAYASNDPDAPISEWTKITQKYNNRTEISERGEENSPAQIRYLVDDDNAYRYVKVYAIYNSEERFSCTEVEVYGEPELKSNFATLALSSDIAVRFYANKLHLDFFENVNFVASANGFSETVPVTEAEIVSYNGLEYYVYTFVGVSPSRAGDDITVKLTSGDKSGKEVVYSIKDYCMNQIANSSDSKLKTLCVDLLNYCASVQTYSGYKTDALVNADLTDEQKALATTDYSSLKNVFKVSTDTITGVKVNSAKLFLTDTITVRFTVTAESVEGLTATINDTPVEFVNAGNGKYYVYFKAADINDYSESITLKLTKGEQSTTVTYSVATYALRMISSETSNLSAVCGSLLKYITSVTAYA